MTHLQGTDQGIILQPPSLQDASALYQLIIHCKPLDVNSEYLYLLLCAHHRETCGVAFLEGDVVGAVTGYIIPERQDTLFIWQVAVSKQVRNQGLGKKMIKQVLGRRSCTDVRFIEATVSPTNKASLRLFESLAQEFKAEFNQTPYFGKELFRDEDHEEENLIRVGPFK